ncbi:MAG: elongation factor G [Hyphomicrobiaceae bacterium]|nr:elongation factor G [Hyphomicrobiaceae bacterium]
MGQETGPSGGSRGPQSGAASERSARCIAIVGPFLSGKTTLLEAILARTGAVSRQGTITEKNTIGDATPEAREHAMSVELNVADATFLDERFTFVDCPGSIEFQHEADAVLDVCDAAIVVCEPDAKRVPALQLILKDLEDRGVPHLLFLNKIDTFHTPVRDLLPILQPASARPLVLRQIPIWENGTATGFIDLALERAFVYREHAPSEVIEMPKGIMDREQEARFTMLEALADYDDDLMEQLLSDVTPDRAKVFADLVAEMQAGQICPVFLGSAEHGNGIARLLKALRHEAPGIAETAERLGIADGAAVAHVIKSIHTTHAGKISLARVLGGSLADNTTVTGPNGEARVSGIFAMSGQDAKKRGTAMAGETVGLGRLETARTGDTLGAGNAVPEQIGSPAAQPSVFATAITLTDRKDEVRLTAALAKLSEEDPTLSLEHDAATGQIVLLGQGEMHLRVALERLARKYGVTVERGKRATPYRETIRGATTVRGRHKKQSGGHGQFGDVVLEIKPQPRGAGFAFSDTIVGGAVPKQYIPSVEIGVKDYLTTGPLGFPVVDVAVVLKDGSYHTVDSSDMAFRQAGRLAMSEGMPDCSPVLLEPVMRVDIAVPSEATPRVNAMISQRRGQILGYDGRDGWPGWDVVQAHIPQSEIEDLIIELRSATQGVGTFTAAFDHLAELNGRLADQVLAQGRAAAE